MTTPASDETERLCGWLEIIAAKLSGTTDASALVSAATNMRALKAERDKYKSEADSLKEWKNSLEEYRLTPKYGGWYELGIESSGDRVFVEREIK